MFLVLRVLAIFGLGLGVGAGVSLLVAPKSGREMRRDLSVRAGDLRDNVTRTATRLGARVRPAHKVPDNGKHHEDWSSAKTLTAD